MQLSLQTFTTLVQNMAAAVQSAATQLVDLTVGSTLRAVLEANASIALWIQWLILQVLQSTRAATSIGPDLDSWMADFTLSRLAATPASGTVTFSRFTPLAPALVPVGVLIRTADGSQTFAVTADPTNPAWNPASNGYVLAAGVADANIPATAQVPGSAGNVQAGAIALLATAVPGIDAVVNQMPFQNGLDAETDAALRARFQNFIQSRSRATPLAIAYAIVSTQPGLRYLLQENVTPAGAPMMGSFVVTIDDGSGSPPGTLLTAVQSAVEAVRPVGSIYTIQPPTVITANVALTLTITSGVASAPIFAATIAAITTYVDSLPIGATLPITRLSQIAYSTDSNVLNVTGVLINAASSDLIPPATGVAKAGTVTVS